MQVQLGDQFSNLPGPVDEQRQQPALELLFGVADSWPLQLYRSRTQRQLPGRCVSVPVAGVVVPVRPAGRPGPPRNSVTSSSSSSWISLWSWPRTQSSNCSHSGLDSDLLPVLLFPIGGVSPLLGLEPVLFRERVHRLTVYTPSQGTSVLAPGPTLTETSPRERCWVMVTPADHGSCVYCPPHSQMQGVVTLEELVSLLWGS